MRCGRSCTSWACAKATQEIPLERAESDKHVGVCFVGNSVDLLWERSDGRRRWRKKLALPEDRSIERLQPTGRGNKSNYTGLFTLEGSSPVPSFRSGWLRKTGG